MGPADMSCLLCVRSTHFVYLGVYLVLSGGAGYIRFMATTRQQVGIKLEAELVARVDAAVVARGLPSRTAGFEEALEAWLSAVAAWKGRS